MKKIFTNKKAIGAEVDWIIAGGIFLIYLLMTLVYFKPGLNPVHNPDNLLDIVEDGFEHDSYWTITTQPMFVEAIPYKCDCAAPPSTIETDLSKDGTCAPCLNTGGNSKCVEFKGEYDGTAFVANNQNFPLKLEDDKTKIFFVGAKTTEATPNTVIEEDVRKNKEQGECTDIDNKIENTKTKIESLNGPGGSKTDCLKTLKEVCDYIEKKCVINGIFQGDQEVEEADKCDNHISDYHNCNDCKKAMDDLALFTLIKDRCDKDAGEENTNENIEINTNLNEKEYRKGYLTFGIESNNLRFIPLFIDGQKTKYILTYSSDVINKEPSIGCSGLINDAACIIKDTAGYIPNSVCHAKYELGVSETVKGISLTKLMGLALSECNEGNTKGYECVKNTWGYPSLKDFKIRIYTKDKTIAEFPKEPIIPTNINVYSRQFNSFILNEDGLREAVTVNILVW